MAIGSNRLDVDRDVYSVTYDPAEDGIVGATVSARFENTDDVSVYTGSNDGEFVVTVAKGFTGTDHVTITGSESGEVSGEVTFG